ncbi:hypothetical protein [Andreprevotia chitinilytica]|uniref:hypothetical protein n=1 Tax=Andreprevotia chitinilytica TaxID=396808 RepID=UPI000551125B|nr:hypothetical protein [Andreprevotia chitinilytica]
MRLSAYACRCVFLLLACCPLLALAAASQKLAAPKPATSQAAPHLPDNLESIALMALAPNDGMAVVRLPDGSLQQLKKGTQADKSGARLVDVLPDRLVLLRPTAAGDEMVWMFPAGANGKAAPLRVISSARPKAELRMVPVRTISQASGAAGAGQMSLLPPSTK